MLRREFLFALATGSVLGPPATNGPRTPRMSPVSESGSPERGDWYPHHTVDIEKDGRATVSLALRGHDPPEEVKVINKWVKDLEFTSGEEALTLYDSGNLWPWDTTVSDTLEYTLSLGHHGPNAGSFSTTVRDSAVLSATNEILPLIDWKGGNDQLPSSHRYTVNPPGDWSVALPGTLHDSNTFEGEPRRHFVRFPTNHFVVGDFSVHSSTNEAVDARAIALPSAEGPSGKELLSLLEDTIPVLESRFGEETTHGRLGIVVPAEVEEGGQALDQSFLLNERNSLDGRTHSVAVHELAHTFQRFGGPGWHQEGMVSYLANLLLNEVDRISAADFYERLRKYTTGPDRFTVGPPYDVPAAEEPYKKGAGVYAALDSDVRARADGEADIGAFIAGVNDQRGDGRVIDRSEALTTLYSVTGIDYSDFFTRFVDGTEFPSEILDEDFSITDPEPIGFAAFKYPEVRLSPSSPTAGETLSVSIDIANVGAIAGTRTLEFAIGGRTTATADIALDPDEKTTVTFDHTPGSPGSHHLSVSGLPIYSITVRSQETPTPTSTPSPTPTTTQTDTEAENNPTTSPTAMRTPTTGHKPETTDTPGQPGLGIISAIAGIGSVVGYLVCRDKSTGD